MKLETYDVVETIASLERSSTIQNNYVAHVRDNTELKHYGTLSPE